MNNWENGLKFHTYIRRIWYLYNKIELSHVMKIFENVPNVVYLMIIILLNFSSFVPLPILRSFFSDSLVSLFPSQRFKIFTIFLQLGFYYLKSIFHCSNSAFFQWIKHCCKADVFDKCRVFTVIVQNTKTGTLLKAKCSTYCDRTNKETKKKYEGFFFASGQWKFSATKDTDFLLRYMTDYFLTNSSG